MVAKRFVSPNKNLVADVYGCQQTPYWTQGGAAV